MLDRLRRFVRAMKRSPGNGPDIEFRTCITCGEPNPINSHSPFCPPCFVDHEIALETKRSKCQ